MPAAIAAADMSRCRDHSPCPVCHFGSYGRLPAGMAGRPVVGVNDRESGFKMYEGGPYITTHQIADEFQTFKEVARWRNIIEVAKQEHGLNEVELKIRERYEGRY